MQAAAGGVLPERTHTVPARHSAWMLRPLIDLGPFEIGPIYAKGVEFSWTAMTDPRLPRFVLQRIQPSNFRELVLRAAGDTVWHVTDPRAVPAPRRTPRWQILCDQLDEWDRSAAETRCRVGLLLLAMGMHDAVLGLAHPAMGHPGDADPAAIELAYWHEVARYMVRMPSSLGRYRDADLSRFGAIASAAAHAVPTAFNAALRVLIHLSKTGADAQQLRPWAELAQQRLDDAASQLDEFYRTLLDSRLQRARAFVPMAEGQQHETVRLMDRAESAARALQPRNAAEQLLVVENLHPVVESRAKEALWLGDLELACARALEVTQLDPYDPKSWLELGQMHLARERWNDAVDAFMTAARLGPPCGAIACHLAGVSLRRAGRETMAAYFFQQSLEIDPMAISPRVEIAAQPPVPALDALKAWSGYQFETLA